MSKEKIKKVCVVVLGDIGRSPRMQYHSLSLANAGYNVDIIGYEESKINNNVIQHSNINISPLKAYDSSPLRFLNKPAVPKSVNYVFKTIWQLLTLLCALTFKRADYVLVQNPPAVPTLFCCAIYCVIVRAKFIIDWHNYAYSIMLLTNKKNSLFVRITKFAEAYFGSWAHYNLCVTEAMKNDLKENWDITATVLYDRPPRTFHPIALKERHEFLRRFSEQYNIFKGTKGNETVITCIDKNGDIHLKDDRPAVLISSTSWTEDEDFSILLNALKSE